MSYSIRPRVARTLAATLTVAPPSVAAPALAGAACATSSTSHPFSQFGDSAAYSLLPGGSFEAGAPGWVLTQRRRGFGQRELQGRRRLATPLAIQPNGWRSRRPVRKHLLPLLPLLRATHERQLGCPERDPALERILGNDPRNRGRGDPELTSWTPTPILKLATTLPLWQSGSTLSASWCSAGTVRRRLGDR